MLASLLLNRIGNTAGKTTIVVDDGRAQAALQNLREEFFERQAELDRQRDAKPQAVEKQDTIYKFKSLELPGATATLGDSVDAELALLLILAEL